MRKCFNCNWSTQEEKMYCERCGTKLTEVQDTGMGNDMQLKKKLKRWRICSVVFIILAIVMTIGMVAMMDDRDYWHELASDKREEVYSLQEEIESLKEELGDLQVKEANVRGDYEDLLEYVTEANKQIDFMDEYVAIVRADNGTTTLYHTYECFKKWSKPSFRIYNIKAAENEGYSACPDCH